MSDILIPMGRDPGHEGMDDTAEWATDHPRPFHAQGCDGQGRYKPTYPAEPDPTNAVMGMDESFDSADTEHANFITTVLMLVIYGLSALAAWHAFWFIVETMVEAAP